MSTNAYDILLANLEGEIQLQNTELWAEMKSQSKAMTLKKNENLVNVGSKQKYVYFIASGSMAVYSFTREGERKAIWFHFDDLFSMAAAPDSYYLNEPTKYEITALEETSVIRFSKQSFDLWILKYPRFNKFYIEGITYGRVIVQEARVQRLISTPEQYYHYLSEKFPSMVSRISSKNMAHFLGLSPEWFSKLKKRMESNIQ